MINLSRPYRFLVLLLALSGLTTELKAQNLADNLDIYGTTQISLEQIKRTLGEDIRILLYAYQNNERRSADSLRKVIVNRIRKMGDFAYVAITPITYYSEGNPVYITIDVVDAADAAERMPFHPVPASDFADPDSLLYYWEKYEATGMSLMRQNKIDFPVSCAAFHCLFGFSLPELQPYAQKFFAKTEPNKARMIQILKEDKDGSDRARAAYVLAHVKNGEELVSILLPSLYDSYSLVRNNVMRVLSDISLKHPEIPIPLDKIVQALRFPDVSDRNKALVILYGLAKRPELKEEIRLKAGSILLELLKLKQPNNKEESFAVLKELSGKDFRENDYPAWEKWINKSQ